MLNYYLLDVSSRLKTVVISLYKSISKLLLFNRMNNKLNKVKVTKEERREVLGQMIDADIEFDKRLSSRECEIIESALTRLYMEKNMQNDSQKTKRFLREIHEIKAKVLKIGFDSLEEENK